MKTLLACALSLLSACATTGRPLSSAELCHYQASGTPTEQRYAAQELAARQDACDGRGSYREAVQAQQWQAFGNLGAAILANPGSPPPAPYTPPQAPMGSVTGFLTGSTTNGLIKICYYNKLGSVSTLNVSSVALCPLTSP